VKKAKLLFLVSEDWYFCSHRLHIASAALQAGMDIYVATRVNRHGGAIERAGLKLVPINLHRGGFSPLHDLKTLASLTVIYRRVRPNIVHHVAMKPVLYGSLAAAICGVPHVINALAGMGFVFSSQSRKAAWLRPWILLALRRLLNVKGQCLVVQNPDDREWFISEIGLPESEVTLIPGSGVDIQRFHPEPYPKGPPVVVTLVARMIEDKGVREFVDAIKLLRQEGLSIKGVLVGEEDVQNPAHIPHDTLRGWEKEGVIEWWGRRENIPEIWAQSHIAVLPSYREGLPKSLLEAAACGRPIVATDVPGCREIVKDGYNGLLVRPKDVKSLAAAISSLAANEALRKQMGRNGRKLVEEQFSNERVQRDTLALYHRLLTA